ncbi:hypothetical protein Skr01_14170 [Sphaerisporangium krabiense]|uniref:Putative ester cyclase n=1 Tax=Sphaerisporangium krabiense TaxID=763782 RepID=A0A7W8YZI6_9ACTN|nr:ester cyclase [Sphaerisporangium krabiense]MBB5624708.1 putative ester cyclase [Sphaerisporangium krabiense]GII61332.1 hypothetical protein Skr01_14170 [Sphaerisporangium krabiense]
MPEAAKRVDLFFDACNAHDLEAVARHYAPDVILVAPGGLAEGLDEVLSYHDVVWRAFPDERFTVLQTIAQGEEVATTVLLSGTHTGPFLLAGGEVVQPTGRHVSVRSCWTFTLQDTLIADHQLFLDQLELYTRLGVPLLGSLTPVATDESL